MMDERTTGSDGNDWNNGTLRVRNTINTIVCVNRLTKNHPVWNNKVDEPLFQPNP